MDKKSLYTLADILQSLDSSNRTLFELLNTMNLTVEEREKIEDSIFVIMEKIDSIKRTNIKELDKYVDFEQIKKISRY
jgi:GTP1/Obg family GTP-binding protein